MRLTGKRAFITGAGSGIGEATALLFAREGARVALVGRRRDRLDSVARQIARDGGQSLVLPADVSRESEVESAVESAVDAWGGLDTCVTAAAIEPADLGDGRVDQLDVEKWSEIISINLTGTFLTCKHVIRAMLATGRGSVIVTGSPTGVYGSALGQHAYSASKAGCHGLARVMAHEYAAHGIRVNVVIPGVIDTPLTKRLIEDAEALANVVGRIPMRRAGQADEVAAMNLWLASDESGYATGGYFVVDGGWTAV